MQSLSLQTQRGTIQSATSRNSTQAVASFFSISAKMAVQSFVAACRTSAGNDGFENRVIITVNFSSNDREWVAADDQGLRRK